MPLRRVTVDWGDGIRDGGVDAKFRNHKSVCSGNTTPAPVCGDSASGNGSVDVDVTCQADKDCQNVKGASWTCGKDGKSLTWSFGNWSGIGQGDGACQEGFFQFMHAYTFSDDCDGAGSPIIASPSSIEQYNLTGIVGQGERFCVFQPKVQLMDNWDICNGVKSESDLTPFGYINNSLGSPCDEKTEAFTPFQGYIIVKE